MHLVVRGAVGARILRACLRVAHRHGSCPGATRDPVRVFRAYLLQGFRREPARDDWRCDLVGAKEGAGISRTGQRRLIGGRALRLALVPWFFCGMGASRTAWCTSRKARSSWGADFAPVLTIAPYRRGF